jgi:polyhydroxyalkanoate synthase subunit PhaC
VLTRGGHNSGIVNEPGNPRSRYHRTHRPAGAFYVGPDDWLAKSTPREGSWWPDWKTWLEGKSGGLVAPPPTGAPDSGLEPMIAAPGTYLFQT